MVNLSYVPGKVSIDSFVLRVHNSLSILILHRFGFQNIYIFFWIILEFLKLYIKWPKNFKFSRLSNWLLIINWINQHLQFLKLILNLHELSLVLFTKIELLRSIYWSGEVKGRGLTMGSWNTILIYIQQGKIYVYKHTA